MSIDKIRIGNFQTAIPYANANWTDNDIQKDDLSISINTPPDQLPTGNICNNLIYLLNHGDFADPLPPYFTNKRLELALGMVSGQTGNTRLINLFQRGLVTAEQIIDAGETPSVARSRHAEANIYAAELIRRISSLRLLNEVEVNLFFTEISNEVIESSVLNQSAIPKFFEYVREFLSRYTEDGTLYIQIFESVLVKQVIESLNNEKTYYYGARVLEILPPNLALQVVSYLDTRVMSDMLCSFDYEERIPRISTINGLVGILKAFLTPEIVDKYTPYMLKRIEGDEVTQYLSELTPQEVELLSILIRVLSDQTNYQKAENVVLELIVSIHEKAPTNDLDPLLKRKLVLMYPTKIPLPDRERKTVSEEEQLAQNILDNIEILSEDRDSYIQSLEMVANRIHPEVSPTDAYHFWPKFLSLEVIARRTRSAEEVLKFVPHLERILSHWKGKDLFNAQEMAPYLFREDIDFELIAEAGGSRVATILALQSRQRFQPKDAVSAIRYVSYSTCLYPASYFWLVLKPEYKDNVVKELANPDDTKLPQKPEIRTRLIGYWTQKPDILTTKQALTIWKRLDIQAKASHIGNIPTASKRAFLKHELTRIPDILTFTETSPQQGYPYAIVLLTQCAYDQTPINTSYILPLLHKLKSSGHEIHKDERLIINAWLKTKPDVTDDLLL